VAKQIKRRKTFFLMVRTKVRTKKPADNQRVPVVLGIPHFKKWLEVVGNVTN
jgi:hypothetical protein